MNFWPLVSSFLVIFLAELGDKTQLLTIGFATRFPFWEVLVSVAVATGVLMAVAVLFGGVINYWIPAFYVQLFAAALFIFYGIKTLLEKEEGEEKSEGKGGSPFWIVFSAFLLAEMGDKTQLGTLALTAKYGAPFQVWLGATAGMVGANILGGVAGRWIHARFSERMVRWVGGFVFIIFGLWTLGELFIW